MSKPVPLDFDKYYHIYNRGNNRENIFIQERNYHHFMKLYGFYIEPIAETFAYCLLRNHFHFLVRIKSRLEIQAVIEAGKEPRSPSQQFGIFFNAYAKAINEGYGRVGSLFQHPFGRIEVQSSSYFTRLIAYIHRNPQKHGFVDDFRDWPFSSYQAIKSTKPTRLSRDKVCHWFEGIDGFDAAHLVDPDERLIQFLINDD